MITQEQALHFAEKWIQAWNTHDLDAILSHYADDIELTTPFIVSIMNDPSGTLKGKKKLREYWKNALTLVPGLKFEFISVLSSVNSIIINYHSVRGKTAAEFFTFGENGKVVKSVAHYD